MGQTTETITGRRKKKNSVTTATQTPAAGVHSLGVTCCSTCCSGRRSEPGSARPETKPPGPAGGGASRCNTKTFDDAKDKGGGRRARDEGTRDNRSQLEAWVRDGFGLDIDRSVRSTLLYMVQIYMHTQVRTPRAKPLPFNMYQPGSRPTAAPTFWCGERRSKKALG